ncbi:lipase member H-A-like isoform X1 [Armigeres subalbatus]|uniref:lipase member H-A-like isoform X1 n=1 Tax=Armigeres subalbatus TaxID=124917 RepID=UPI002ED61964
MARFSLCICALLWLGDIVNADRSSIIFREDNDDPTSFASRFYLDMDDMEYEQDNGNESLVPKLILDRDEEQNYITLPDKKGEFQVVPRKAVVESRQNSSQYEAAEFVKFHFYARSNNYQPVELRYDQIQFLPDHHGFNIALPTKILIHGWLGGSDSDVIEPLAKDFLDQGNFNIIAVDWEKGARTLLYPVARYRVSKVAELVAAVIDQLLQFGQSSDQIGLIGHSLGAHIAGLAGKKTKKKVAFIVGLDPAAPLFRLKKPTERLSNNDAHYVEVIHTNGKALGMFGNIGKTDFYPNGGSSQPGCGWNLSCSHQRAVDYFKESLKSKNYFANRCTDVEDLHPKCALGKAVMGGLEALKTRGKPDGVYYAATAADKPFLRNLDA